MKHSANEEGGPETAESRPRWRRLVAVVCVVFAVVTGVVAFAASLTTIYGWLAPYVPAASRLSDEKAVTKLSAGAQLSVFAAALGQPAARRTDGGYVEYVFVRRNCYVQAVTDPQDRVLMFTVITRNSEFRPVFDSPSSNGFTNPVRLGVTTFSEVSHPDWIGGFFGADWMNYVEYVALPHADNFRSVIVACCDAGHHFGTRGEPEDGQLADPSSWNAAIAAHDPTDRRIQWFRTATPVNTYGEAAPGFSPAALYDDDGRPKLDIMVGIEPEHIPDVEVE